MILGIRALTHEFKGTQDTHIIAPCFIFSMLLTIDLIYLIDVDLFRLSISLCVGLVVVSFRESVHVIHINKLWTSCS